MNEEQVKAKVTELYKEEDQIAKLYLEDLETGFDPAAYENMSDRELMIDVERYRAVNHDYVVSSEARPTQQGAEIFVTIRPEEIS